MTHSPRVYWTTCFALMCLLASTWCIGYINLGVFNLVVALAIAVTKMLLIVLFFMHLKGSSRILHLAAIVGLVWLGIMLTLTLSDYFTRSWMLLPR